MLLCVFSCDCNTGDSEYVDATAPGDWTRGGLGQNGNFNCIGAWFWKIAEGSDALTITTSGSVGSGAQQSTHICYRITGGYSVTGSVATSTGGSNSNPPSHTPPDGTQDYLWIVTRSGDNTVVATVAPTNFTNLLTEAANNTTGASTNTAERQFNGSVLDPGNFTSGSEQWVSWTLAVSPVNPATGFPYYYYTNATGGGFGTVRTL